LYIVAFVYDCNKSDALLLFVAVAAAVIIIIIIIILIPSEVKIPMVKSKLKTEAGVVTRRRRRESCFATK